MTTGAEVLAAERPRLLTQLVGSYVDLDENLTGPGLQPWHGAILEGFVRAAAAILTDCPAAGHEFLAQVRTAFVGLVGAVEEHAEFEADPDGYLDKRGNPTSFAAMKARVDADLDFWTARLGLLQPMAKVVGL